MKERICWPGAVLLAVLTTCAVWDNHICPARADPAFAPKRPGDSKEFEGVLEIDQRRGIILAVPLGAKPGKGEAGIPAQIDYRLTFLSDADEDKVRKLGNGAVVKVTGVVSRDALRYEYLTVTSWQKVKK